MLQMYNLSKSIQARPLLSQALENNNFDCVADPRLQKDYDSVEMARMVACASVCVRHLARRRPKMSQVHLYMLAKNNSPYSAFKISTSTKVLPTLKNFVLLILDADNTSFGRKATSR